MKLSIIQKQGKLYLVQNLKEKNSDLLIEYYNQLEESFNKAIEIANQDEVRQKLVNPISTWTVSDIKEGEIYEIEGDVKYENTNWTILNSDTGEGYNKQVAIIKFKEEKSEIPINKTRSIKDLIWGGAKMTCEENCSCHTECYFADKIIEAKMQDIEKERDEFVLEFVDWFCGEESKYGIGYGNPPTFFLTDDESGSSTQDLLEMFKKTKLPKSQ